MLPGTNPTDSGGSSRKLEKGKKPLRKKEQAPTPTQALTSTREPLRFSYYFEPPPSEAGPSKAAANLAEEGLWQTRTVREAPALIYHAAPAWVQTSENPEPHQSPYKMIDLRHTEVVVRCAFQEEKQSKESPTSSAIKEIIISRHKNKSGREELNNFVSIIVHGTVGMTQSLYDCFASNKELDKGGISTNSELDYLSPQMCVAVTDATPNKFKKCRDILTSLLKIADLPKNFIDTYMQLIDPSIPSEAIAIRHPKDENFRIRHYQTTFTWGEDSHYVVYDKRFDKYIESAMLPAIHTAILNGDEALVTYILTEDPEQANVTDQFGIAAHVLALNIGPLEIFKACVEARKHFRLRSDADVSTQTIYQMILETWERTGYNYAIMIGKKPGTPPAEVLFYRARAAYMELIANGPPQIDILHTACLSGDLQSVQAILTAQPYRIDEKDYYGKTPLANAAMGGHAEIVKWLLSEDRLKPASLKVQEYKSALGWNKGKYAIIDMAKTPEVLEFLLHKGAKPKDGFKNRLFQAIWENDVKMAECIFYYIYDLPTARNISVYETILLNSHKHGTDMLKSFMKYYRRIHRRYLPSGPFDGNLPRMFLQTPSLISDVSPYKPVSEDARKLIAEYNNLVADDNRARLERPKLFSQSLSESFEIVEEFKRPCGTVVKSYIRPIATLTNEEKDEIAKLFFSNFGMETKNTKMTKEEYLRFALSRYVPKEGAKVYKKIEGVNLFRVDEKLVSFYTFDITELDDCVVYHGRLAGNMAGENYKRCGFLELGMRTMLAHRKLYCNGNKPMYNFMKMISPGIAFYVIPAEGSYFYPKHTMPSKLISKIVESTGEVVNGKTILAKLKVISKEDSKQASKEDSKEASIEDLKEDSKEALKNSPNHDSTYYEHLIGEKGLVGNPEDAMAVCCVIDDKFMGEFMKDLAYNGIDEFDMQLFTLNWQAFTEKYPYELGHKPTGPRL